VRVIADGEWRPRLLSEGLQGAFAMVNSNRVT
jgi:hypothetical protein